MKQLMIALLLPAIVFAQAPEITRANYYETGDRFLRVMKFDTALNSIVVDSGGANVTWNYSAVDFAHPSVMVDTLTCLLPDSTPFFNVPIVNYDTSTLALRIDTDPFSPDDDNYIYYLDDNNALQYVGSWANNGGSERTEYNFTNLRTDLVFPLSYNESYTDSFQSSYNDQSGSGMHYQHGTLRLTTDGYGTLITYDDTLQNVLRLREEITVHDSSGLFGTSTTTHLNYYWYAEGAIGPVMQYTMDMSTPGLVLTAYYFRNMSPPNAIEVHPSLSSFHIYPNPATEWFAVNVESLPSINYTLSVFNITGKLMQTRSITTSGTRINIENIPPGMYIVELRNEHGLRVNNKVFRTGD